MRKQDTHSGSRYTIFREEFKSVFHGSFKPLSVIVLVSISLLAFNIVFTIPNIGGEELAVSGPSSNVVSESVQESSAIEFSSANSQTQYRIVTQDTHIHSVKNRQALLYRFLTESSLMYELSEISDISILTEESNKPQKENLFLYEQEVPYNEIILVTPILFIISMLLYSTSSIVYDRISRKYETYILTPISEPVVFLAIISPPVVACLIISLASMALFSSNYLLGVFVFVLGGFYISLGSTIGIVAKNYESLTALSLLSLLLVSLLLVFPLAFVNSIEIAKLSPLYLILSAIQSRNVPPMIVLASGLLPVVASTILLWVSIFLFDSYERVNGTLNNMMSEISDVPSSNVIYSILFGFVCLPFVFTTELLVLPLGFIVGQEFGGVLILVSVVVIEELFKSSVFFFTKMDISKFRRFVLGFALGVGFLVGEKSIVYAQSYLLPTVNQTTTIETLLSQSGESVIGLVLLIFWPLVHPLSTGVASLGGGSSLRSYLKYLSLAILMHLSYNLLGVINNVQ